MVVRFAEWLAILFTTLATVPGGAHLAELPNKMKLGREEYFIVQKIYEGWSLFGIVLIGTLATNLALTILLMMRGERFGFVLAAFLLAAANLAIFFTWTFPANRATQNWTSAPENWEMLRTQWEYSHAVNALVMFAALACLLVAVVRRSP